MWVPCCFPSPVTLVTSALLQGLVLMPLLFSSLLSKHGGLAALLTTHMHVAMEPSFPVAPSLQPVLKHCQLTS